MKHNQRRLLVTALTLTAVVMPLGISACGSSDDSGNDDAPQAKQTASGPTRSGGDPDGPPDAQIRATYDMLVDAIYANKPQAVCDLLSPAAQKKLARESTCAKRLGDYIEHQGRFISDRPKVIGVTIRGQRALARAKTRKSNAYTIPFVKAGSTWQVDGGFETAGL